MRTPFAEPDAQYFTPERTAEFGRNAVQQAQEKREAQNQQAAEQRAYMEKIEPEITYPTLDPTADIYIHRYERLRAYFKSQLGMAHGHNSALSDIMIYQTGKELLPELADSTLALADVQTYLDAFITKAQEWAERYKKNVGYRHEFTSDYKHALLESFQLGLPQLAEVIYREQKLETKKPLEADTWVANIGGSGPLTRTG
jgi:hypothetical protein